MLDNPDQPFTTPPTRREDAPGSPQGPPETRREPATPWPGETRREPVTNRADDAGEGWTGGLLRLPASLRGTWTIVRDLPGGGEADVVLVSDATGLERVVKIYRRSVAVDAEAARRLTTLDRSYLVAPYQNGYENDRHWELMEYVPGGSLAEHVDPPRTPPMSGADIVETIRQITEALAELHRAQITHSDLKPANILIRQRAPLQLALSDFGLSKYLGAASKRFTRLANTVAYASPESFAGRFSPAQDWWALGIVVRELATGTAPFAGLAEQVAMHELLVRDVATDDITDNRLRLLCRGLLVRDPDHRWTETQVRLWLAGKDPKVHDAADVRATQPLKVANQTCWTRAEAARAFATNWEYAQQTFLERIGTAAEPGAGWQLLRSWLEQFDEDLEQRARLIDQVLSASVAPQVRMVHLLRWLDPGMPPNYRNLSLLPEHVAQVAAAAGPPDSPATRVVDELWRYRLLEVLAQFAGGDRLIDVDRQWRISMSRLDAIRSAPMVPPPAKQALLRSAVLHQATLLRAAADPDVADDLAQRAGAARAAVPEPPQWFQALNPSRECADALAVLTVLPVAQAEYDQLVRFRNRGRLAWEEEERLRLGARPKALGYAAAAAAIWAVVMVTGAFAALTAAPMFGVTTAPTDPTLPADTAPDPLFVALLVYGFVWFANTAAEVGVAYLVGGPYHPRWSALTALTWLGRRLPDAWNFTRRSGNAVRALGAASPVLFGLCCCFACFMSGFIIGLVSGAYALATLGTATGHLAWALIRAIRFTHMRSARRRQLVGDNNLRNGGLR